MHYTGHISLTGLHEVQFHGDHHREHHFLLSRVLYSCFARREEQVATQSLLNRVRVGPWDLSTVGILDEAGKRPGGPRRLQRFPHFHRKAYGVERDYTVRVESGSSVRAATGSFPSSRVCDQSKYSLPHTCSWQRCSSLLQPFCSPFFHHTHSVKLLTLAKYNSLHALLLQDFRWTL